MFKVNSKNTRTASIDVPEVCLLVMLNMFLYVSCKLVDCQYEVTRAVFQSLRSIWTGIPWMSEWCLFKRKRFWVALVRTKHLVGLSLGCLLKKFNKNRQVNFSRNHEIRFKTHNKTPFPVVQISVQLKLGGFLHLSVYNKCPQYWTPISHLFMVITTHET